MILKLFIFIFRLPLSLEEGSIACRAVRGEGSVEGSVLSMFGNLELARGQLVPVRTPSGKKENDGKHVLKSPNTTHSPPASARPFLKEVSCEGLKSGMLLQLATESRSRVIAQRNGHSPLETTADANRRTGVMSGLCSVGRHNAEQLGRSATEVPVKLTTGLDRSSKVVS